ncbi:MAG: hypothetical protein IT204_16910 [Fimbriimonadaceae bacterium]|nr:hypothetical protein [Fimbriimonadaceae bacterium]
MSSERRVDSALTARVKAFALEELGADLVGVANIERFEHAPLLMSPQGILPTARSVVVMAIHHPDACIELGGLTHPQEIGPYRVQYLMNQRLDEISYRLGLWLQARGHQAVPIVSSNIWRYKGYRNLTEHFAPDVSHRHAAVAAGLADFGYSALAITPEFGARQRFVTVITDAELQPDPLLDPHSVCDDCRLCADTCPSGALTKELRGTSVVRIEGREYTYADKNLWRCSWGEHFDLDLDLPIPEQVDEAVILDMVRKHGRRGGEMGCCLRYCMPEERRYWEQSYTNAPRRKRNAPTDDEPNRCFDQQVQAIAQRQGVDFVIVQGPAELRALGLELEPFLPGGTHTVTVGYHLKQPAGADPAAWMRKYQREGAAYDITRLIERRGYDAVCCSAFPEERLQAALTGVLPGRRVETATVVTTAPLPATSLELPVPAAPRGDLRQQLELLLREHGADLVGVAPAARIAALKPHLAAFEGMRCLDAVDQSAPFEPYEPQVAERRLTVRTPDDHLHGAQSVLVFGIRLPAAAIERCAEPPAEAVGPYAFAQYESANALYRMGFLAQRLVEDAGYQGVLSNDLTGTGSVVGNPRGAQPDAFCNRFEAVAAGLGRLTKAGFVTTAEYGPHVRFMALVTDAPLRPDAVVTAPLAAACDGCERCLQACSTSAFNEPLELPLDGLLERFHPIERTRCDWAKRYSLIGEEGVNYLGWDLHVEAPELITSEHLGTALRQQPAIPKYRPCNFESCWLACPLTRPVAAPVAG